jgi:hypothetical protein
MELNLKEKEQRLLKKIEQAQQRLTQLKDKRNFEIGELACRAGLAHFSDEILKTEFESLAKQRAVC